MLNIDPYYRQNVSACLEYITNDYFMQSNYCFAVVLELIQLFVNFLHRKTFLRFWEKAKTSMQLEKHHQEQQGI